MGFKINEKGYNGEPLTYARIQEIVTDFATETITFTVVGLRKKTFKLDFDKNNELLRITVKFPDEFPEDLNAFLYKVLAEQHPDLVNPENFMD